MQPDWASVIERRLNAVETHNAVEEVHRLNVAARLSAIEDTLKWLMRIVVGGLIVAGLTFVLDGGLRALALV